MSLGHVALVSGVSHSKISPGALSRTAAALQKQVLRDFAPVWGVEATVAAFPTLDDVPIGHWPIVVLDTLPDPRADGYHQDQHGQPYALVRYNNAWTLSASHELLEMLADPFARALIAGTSINPSRPGRVQYLREVCDPSEAPEFAYHVNGVLVSDFYTPHFFDPVTSSVLYSFGGHIKKPRQVLKGGYLSWLDPSDNTLWQLDWTGTKPVFVDLSARAKAAGIAIRPVRQEIHSVSTHPAWRETGLPKNSPALTDAKAESNEGKKLRKTQASRWRGDFKAVLKR